MGSDSAQFKQRRRDATAQVLIAAAETVIARKGYEKVTMREIATEAGCTAGTLYTYFKNKRDLVYAIIESHANVALERFFAAINRDLPPLQRLHCIMQTVVDYASGNRNLFRVLYSGAPVRPLTVMPGLPEHIRTDMERLWQKELDAIKEAQAAGQIRQDFDPESIHRFMHGLVMGFLESTLVHETPPPPDEQMRKLWGFFTGGIGAKAQ